MPYRIDIDPQVAHDRSVIAGRSRTGSA
jgi:hypothetical protein